MRRAIVFSWVLLGGVLEAPAAAPPGPVVEARAVRYPSRGERGAGVVHRPAGQGPFAAVVVVPGEAGLTASVEAGSRALAAKGYVVLTIDLYRGVKVKGVEEAHVEGSRLSDRRVLGDIRGALNLLAARPDVRRAAIAVLGYDTGGGYALDAAVVEPRFRAVVTCYGRVRTEAESLQGLRAPVLGVFAEKDDGNDPKTLQEFRDAMRQAGKRLAGLHVLRDAQHGFLSPAPWDRLSRADREAAATAWKHIDAFLAAELRR
jgi:dienelactone hydrolase